MYSYKVTSLVKIILLSLLLTSKTLAASNLTLSVGYGQAANSEMAAKNLRSSGLVQKLKFGFLKSNGTLGASELGFLIGERTLKSNTTHDSISTSVENKISSFGLFYTLYFSTFYSQFTYNRNVIKSNIRGNLSQSQRNAVFKIYNLDSGETNSDSLEVLIGYKVFELSGAIFNLAVSHSIHQTTTFKETNLLFETKFRFQ